MFTTALLPALNLCLFVPLTLLLGNPEEFDSPVLSLLSWLGLAGLGLAVVFALPGLAWRSRSRARAIHASVLFVFGLLLWLQGAFLMHDYGALDGRGIEWTAFGVLHTLDLLLWVGMLVLAVVLARLIAKLAVFGSVVFIALQAAPLAADLNHLLDEPQPTISNAPPPELFEYSVERNIVHIVLDNFQTDVFLSLVDELDLEASFEGFTLYRENVAAAPHTSLAVPTLFTGEVFDGSEALDEFYKRAQSEGFHVALKDAGFVVNLVPLLSMREAPATHYYEVPSSYAGSKEAQLARELAQLFDVSMFRQAPHGMRRWIHNGDNWRWSQIVYDPSSGRAFREREFLSDYIDAIEPGIDQPAYHYVHLWPPHPPFSTLPSGRPAGKVLPNTLRNYRDEARPMVRRLAHLIEKLQSLGLYDDAFIIIQSDHGGGFEPEHMPRRLMGLMAIKPPGARGPLEISDVQTSVTDVAATVLEAAGVENHDIPGVSILEQWPGPRERRFVYLHEDELFETEITGSAYDPDSLGPARQIEQAAVGRQYVLGTLVTTGMIGEGGRFLASGWSNQQDRHVWNNGHEARLLLELPPPDHDLQLMLEVIPNVDEEKLPTQRVELEVNGHPAGQWSLTEKKKYQLNVDILRTWLDGPELEIRFILPDAASPAAVGTGGDGRTLGIALTRFRLDEAGTEAAP